MTKEEILAMDTGDKLDGLVAKEIMEDNLEHQWEEGPSLTGVKYCVHCGVYDWMPDASKPCSVMPYSIDISAAWQVVEKIRSDNTLLYRFGLALSGMSLGRARELGTDYIADLMRWLCPEAICKAALLANLKDTTKPST